MQPAQVAPKLCEHCGQAFSRRTFKQGKRTRLEAVCTFLARRFCSNECQTARFASERNARLVNQRSISAAIAAGATTARALADRFGVAGVQAKELRDKLGDMAAQRLIVEVGRKGKNEAVFQVPQGQLRSLPMFIEGPGNRRDGCQNYEECLERYDAAHPNSEKDAHCDPGCGFYRPIPRGYWLEAATYRQRVSTSARCEEHASE